MTEEEKAIEQPAQAEVSDENDFAKALTVLSPGDIVTGKVVQVSPDSVMVDVGYKSEGIIPLNELSHRPLQSADQMVSVGDEITVLVVGVDGHEGNLKLSKRKAEEQAAWGSIQAAFEKGEVFDAEVVEVVKGGLVVDIGLRGFMPASQVERGYVADLGKYLGQKVRAKIIELDRHKNRVILSRKAVVEEERRQAKDHLWAELEEGQVREGTVKSLTDFGAFVDLGGVDGLVHVSELSYGRVKHPSEVLSEGQKVTVKVLRLDREKGKVSLGYKQTLADPWSAAPERFPEGSTVTGKVVRLTTFGAFVELEPGIDGLIHISQLAERHVTNPNEVVSPGQEVRVKVLSVKPEDKRISLSLREADAPAE
ncbi:MAG: 30S ribosomal protein S1 [Symbiobacteriia bacterium]